MARSKYVYTLYDATGKPVAHFTVKHEAVRYWETKLERDPKVTMERSPDGGPADRSAVVEGWQT